VTLALLAGAAVGVGLIVILAGLRPAPPTIAALLADLDTGQVPRVVTPMASGAPTGSRRVGEWLLAHGGDRVGTATVRADLAVTGGNVEAFLARKTGWALLGLITPPVVGLAMSGSGTAIPVVIPAWVALCAAAVAFCLPDVRLRSEATSRRRGARTAISAYLDLVAMRMASGAGLPDALADAAAVGDGWTFTAIRAALADARTDGLGPTAALRRLGDDLALSDLTEIATRLSLVDTTGAQAQDSLRAQAASLRDRELTDTAGRAGERSQSMLVAQVVLALGFVIFLGYPAVAKVLAT
jgi:hypothetical protein